MNEDIPVRRDNIAIMDLTFDHMLELLEQTKQGLKLRVMDTTGIKTEEALKIKIAEYIHLNSLEMRPIKLGTLNRRFNKVAHRCGTSTMHVIRELVDGGVVNVFDRKQTILVSSKVVAAQAAAVGASGLYEAQERMLANSL